MGRPWRWLLAALLLASRPARPAEPAPAPAEAASRAETVLSIATHYTDAQRAPLTACLREYERLHPGLRVVHRQSAIEDMLQSLVIARLGGTSPDIVNVYSLWAAPLVRAGVLDAPPPDVARMVAADYLPASVDGVRVGGRAWGIPTELDAYLLLYNRTLFARAGIAEPPRDWDALLADAARLARRDAQGRLAVAGFAFGDTVAGAAHPFLALLASHGLGLLAPGGRGTTLRTPAARAVLAGQALLFTRGLADPALEARDFAGGTVAMTIAANWNRDTLRTAFGPGLEAVGVAPIPGGPDWRTVQYGFFWAVDARSAHRRAAWDLLAWLDTPRPDGRSCTGAMLAGFGALTGNRADLATPGYDDAFTRPFVAALRDGRAVALPDVAHGAELQADLAAAVRAAWAGASPADVLARADREVTALLREPD